MPRAAFFGVSALAPATENERASEAFGRVSLSGISEILLLVAIGLVILMLPRLGSRVRGTQEVTRRGLALTGWMRAGIVVSLAWPALVAVLLKPWQDDPASFFYIGLAPVFGAWGIFWIVMGYKKYRR